MPPLSGRTLALLGARKSTEILSGAGIAAVFKQAESRNQLHEIVAAMRGMTVACRGPKPLAVLKRHDISNAISTAKPHTSIELLAAIESIDIRNAPTLLVHYGERNTVTSDALRSRGALVDDACPYEWTMPDDPQPLAAVVVDALTGRLDAVLFTSQIQCRHLFQVAADMRLTHELAAALNRDVVVAAIGPVCAVALKTLGVAVDVMPAAPNMASLITAVGEYFELTGDDEPVM